MTNWMVWGLLADLIGATLIALPEYGVTSVPLLGKLGKSRTKQDGLYELLQNSKLQPEDDGYCELLQVIKKQNSIEDNIQITGLSVVGRFGAGNAVIATFEDGDSRIIATPSILRSWVETDSTRYYLRPGLLLLISGFTIQLLSQANLI